MQEAQGRTSTKKTKQGQPKSTNKQTTKTKKKNATTPLPFAAGETGETGETETTPSKKQLVQHCGEEADILHEREWDHTNESQTIADEGQVPENDQANQTTKQHKQPKHNQNKPNKKPQPNKQKQQNQPFTLVRRRAQVARPRLEQSKKKITRMHRHALRL